jgi:protocatechuate 3,4-dioxygenase beta subunit
MIDKGQMWLETKQTTTTGLLKDVKFLKVHEYPRFRKLIRDYAGVGKTTIITIDEPGEHLIVSGTIYDNAREPAGNALIYIYQTGSNGWYSDKAYHISGMEGDHRHARLFGYLKTDANGRYEFRTVRPNGYPGSELPAHIHIFVEIADGPEKQGIGTEIQFEDDPRLTSRMRERSNQEGALIRRSRRGSDGILRVEADLSVR